MEPRVDYVARAEANAGVTYAVVIDGQWLEGDALSWEWTNRFNAILDPLADTTLITIVDCHV